MPKPTLLATMFPFVPLAFDPVFSYNLSNTTLVYNYPNTRARSHKCALILPHAALMNRPAVAIPAKSRSHDYTG